MNKIVLFLTISTGLTLTGTSLSIAQSQDTEPPPFQLNRADEDYSYLRNKEEHQDAKGFFDQIKFIPISKNKESHLTLGGEIRPRMESFTNRNWTSKNESFYSQRISLHASINLNKNLRFFSEFYHGYTSHEKEITEYDELNFHQAFVEINFENRKQTSYQFRLGRQEITMGSARLLGIREGPNIRRSYDAVRFSYHINVTRIHAFYGKEVRPEFHAFDNEFSLFDSDAINPELWGVYSQFKIKGDVGKSELYYLGFHSDISHFNDVSGEENRHTIGLRRFGLIGKKWKYNTELIYQFGELDESKIRAFNLESDWYFIFNRSKWQITPGLKLEYTSGDQDMADGKINTFNPMFVNPAYYSLGTIITPVNLVAIHPSITAYPSDRLKLFLEWGFFWRASKNDGLYSPPRFLKREANGIDSKEIGNQIGFKMEYEFSRHLKFDLEMNYFTAGKFIKDSGESENIFHIVPTLSFKF
jgi:hypothetical protein